SAARLSQTPRKRTRPTEKASPPPQVPAAKPPASAAKPPTPAPVAEAPPETPRVNFCQQGTVEEQLLRVLHDKINMFEPTARLSRTGRGCAGTPRYPARRTGAPIFRPVRPSIAKLATAAPAPALCAPCRGSRSPLSQESHQRELAPGGRCKRN